MKPLKPLFLVIFLFVFAFSKPGIKMSIDKGSDLKHFDDKLITAKDLIEGLKYKDDVKEIGVDLISYYYDKKQCSGVCLYYATYFYYHRSTVGGIRWMDGKPFAVLSVINNKEIHYFSYRDIKGNQKLLNDLKASLPQMPDSVVHDSALLRGSVSVQD